MSAPGATGRDAATSLLDVATRDQLAGDPRRDDQELFSVLDQAYNQAAAVFGPEDRRVCALGLEAALFASLPWNSFAAPFTSEDVLELIATRMDSPSARVRATVGGYLWECGRPADKRYGAAAAAAALEWSGELVAYPSNGDSRIFHDGVRALTRAAALAVAAGQKEVLTQVRAQVVGMVADAAALGDVPVASFLVDLMISLAPRFDPAQRQRLVTLLEQLHAPALLNISPISPPDLAGRLLQVRRALLSAQRDQAGAHRMDRLHAALLATHAADRGDPLVESILLEQAIGVAIRGQEEDVVLNVYRQRRRDAVDRGASAMGVVRFEGSLPAELGEALNAEQARLASLPVAEFLHAFAHLSRPRVTLLLAHLEWAQRNTPMSLLISRTVITSPGETVAVGGDQEKRLIEQGLRMLQIGAGLHLIPAWRGRLERGDLTAEAIVSALAATAMFPEDMLEIINSGIAAAVRGDLIAAIHILVPQFEGVLRRLLQTRGHDPSHRNPSDVAVTEEISLGPVRAGLLAANVVSVDDDLLFRLVLDDPLGLNLRNRIGHGLVRAGDCSPLALACVLQCYALVASLPPAATMDDGGLASAVVADGVDDHEESSDSQ